VDPIRAGQQGQGKVTAEELAAPAVYLLCEWMEENILSGFFEYMIF
jgi:hypothetical protein